MSRQRDYKAEYRARVERAQARGLTLRQATGHASRGPAPLPSISELRAAGRLNRPDRSAPRALGARRTPKAVEVRADVAAATGTARVITSGDQRYIIGELRKAAARGDHVSIRATFDTAKGPKTQTIGGSRPIGRVEVTGDRPLGGKVQVAIGRDPSGNGSSIPAAQLLADLDDYDWDLWDLIAEAWDQGDVEISG